MKFNSKNIVAILLFIAAGIFIYLGIMFTKNVLINDNYKIEVKKTKYTVKENDTLDSIASKFNLTANEIMYENNLKNKDIKLDSTIYIPKQTYIYTDEDFNLRDVSEKFQIPLKKLRYVNGVKGVSNTISGKDKLILPNRIVYVVKKGDSINSIAKKYNVSSNLLKKLNKLDNKLKNKSIIMIPNNFDVSEMKEKSKTEKDADIKDFLTNNDIDQIDNLYNFGYKYYNSKEYLKFKSDEYRYFLTYDDLEKMGFDVKNNTKNCLGNDVVISYYKDKSDETAIVVLNNCAL